jgi:hypothetical protein
MKSVDQALDRLFRAAARASQPHLDDAPTMPTALQTRVLAARREWLARRASDEFGAMLALIRRGLAAAGLTAVITVLICHHFSDGPYPPVETMVTESVAELSLLPDPTSP